MLAKTNTILNNRRLLLIGVVMLLILGLFFRVYNFQAWLHFGNDQTRDAFLIENVVKNNAPWPLIGSSMGNTGFLLGPAYYYFQIISVKLFGIGPEKLAYPDLLFNLLAIPLLYFLLKRFFSKNLALSLTGLYGLSYYAIEYSRFAWNPNPIPFFVMLFLLSLWEFLISAEKTKWHWVILLGIATGIGSQLHAILLLVMVGVLGVVFIFLMKKSWRTWSRWLLIFLIVIIANAGQIIYEKQNNFKNSRLFLASFADKSGNGGNKRFFRNLQLNVACNAQANSHIISSLGNKENCDFLYSKARNVRPGAKLQLPNNPLSLLAILVSLCFSVFGYATLAVGIKNEKDKKRKYFAGIILLYAAISFAVMLPIIDQAPLRYFIHLTFLPFIFLGLLAETLKNKVGQKYLLLMVAIFMLIIGTNLFSIFGEAQALANKTRADSGYLVLDETQPLADFMVVQAQGKKQALLFGGKRYYSPYNKALIYLAAQKGLTLKRGIELENFPADTPVFYVGAGFEDSAINEVAGIKFLKQLTVGQIGIYQLQ